MSNSFWLSECPQILASAWVDRDDLTPRRGDCIQRLIDVDRRGAREVVEIRPKIIASPDPSLLEFGKIGFVDLI